MRSDERFSRNAETDVVCRLLVEKKKRPLLYYLSKIEANAPRFLYNSTCNPSLILLR